MRLAKKWLGRFRSCRYALNNRALNISELERLIAMPPMHFQRLYVPIFRQVHHALQAFDSDQSEWSSSLARLIVQCKGCVADDPLQVHIHTFGLCVSAMTLWLSHQCQGKTFTAIDQVKSRRGERKQYFPWRSIPKDMQLRVQLIPYSITSEVLNVSLLFSILPSEGHDWLLEHPDIFSAVIDAVRSNGKAGSYSNILSRWPELEPPVAANVVNKESEEPITVDGNSSAKTILDGFIDCLGENQAPKEHRDRLDHVESSNHSLSKCIASDELVSKRQSDRSQNVSEDEAMTALLLELQKK